MFVLVGAGGLMATERAIAKDFKIAEIP